MMYIQFTPISFLPLFRVSVNEPMAGLFPDIDLLDLVMAHKFKTWQHPARQIPRFVSGTLSSSNLTGKESAHIL